MIAADSDRERTKQRGCRHQPPSRIAAEELAARDQRLITPFEKHCAILNDRSARRARSARWLESGGQRNYAGIERPLASAVRCWRHWMPAKSDITAAPQ